jgi:hypothetical protein
VVDFKEEKGRNLVAPFFFFQLACATKIISGESSFKDPRWKSPNKAATLNPLRASKCSTS